MKLITTSQIMEKYHISRGGIQRVAKKYKWTKYFAFSHENHYDAQEVQRTFYCDKRKKVEQK